MQREALISVSYLLALPSQGNAAAIALSKLLDPHLARSIKQLALARAGAIPRLLALLHHSPHSKTLAVSALAWCALIKGRQPFFDSRLAAEFVTAGAIPVMLSVLEDGSQRSNQFAMATALGSLSEHGIVQQALLDTGAIPSFVQLLGVAQDNPYSTTSCLKREISHTLYNLSQKGGAAWQAAIDAGLALVLQQLPAQTTGRWYVWEMLRKL